MLRYRVKLAPLVLNENQWSSSVHERSQVREDHQCRRSVARWFGREANLRFLPWNEWKALEQFSEKEVAQTWGHIVRSPNFSCAKAERLLDYRPRYTSFQAAYEAVTWLVDQEVVKT